MKPELITYRIAKQVFEKQITKEEGIDKLVTELGMKKGSAQIIIIQVFPKLLTGVKFTRTLSVSYFDCFLSCIYKDYGNRELSNALNALKKHIDYIANRGDSKIKLRKICEKYQQYLIDTTYSLDQDEQEQNDIVRMFVGKSKLKIISELLNLPEKEEEQIIINHKAYKRDNKTIALIKILRNFKCQICGYSIVKKDGTNYIEAAHIIPKNQKGRETPNNILLLCPNHHKEFDLGNCVIKKHTSEEVEFILNEKDYKLSLSIN